jgi:gliding motility-associated-like protein
MRRQVVTILFCVFAKIICAQTCTNTGQTPASAIFVCGSGVILQNTVPACGNISILVPCVNSGNFYINRNPVWFRFACFSDGALGFTITPLDASENFDWQLFDKTGHNPEDVFTDPELFVACNWSGEIGETGASSIGSSLVVCAEPGQPSFSSMPSLVQGHEYLLMVSHFDNSTNGFMIEFTSGVNNITDPVEPYLKSVRTSCDNSQVIVKVNSKIRCNTLATDGSDFSISPSTNILSAAAFSCSSKPDTDSVVLTLSNPLTIGNYTLSVKNGTDGNTLMDYCNRFIATGNSILLPVASLQPTPMDSIIAPSCNPSELELFFSRPIQCGSIAGDGSDFIIVGPQNISISGITIDCGSSASTQNITLNLATSLTTGGNYQVQLKNGSDGNTLIDECGSQTPVSSKSFAVKENVDATFNYSMTAGCKKDTIQFLHTGSGGVTNWLWTFDNATTSILQNPVQVYPATGQYSIKLIVTNGSCSDTAVQNITLDNQVNAAFEVPDIICPEDGLTIQNKTIGSVNSWLWNYGDGNFSATKDPPAYFFQRTGRETLYKIGLTAISSFCRDSVSKYVRVLSSCYIAVPSAFSPNNDGVNDYLYPLNAIKADDLDFRIYNRNGRLVFVTKDWQKKWDGTIKGLAQPSGVYVWILRYTHHDTGQKHELKGTTMLIR